MKIISDKNREIALWVKDYALEQGASAVRVTLAAGVSNSFEFRDQQLDTLESSTESSLQVELFVDQKYGSFASNRLEKDDLKLLIEQGIDAVKYLGKDECKQLPNPERYFKGSDIDLNIYDPNYLNIQTDDKLAIAKKGIDEIYNQHPDIISITSAYSDSISSVFMIDSNGFEAQTDRTNYSLVVSVSLKTATDARPEAYWYDIATHWDLLQKEGIAKIALEKALQKVGQEKVASGQYQMLLDNMTSTKLLSPIISALSGGAIQQRNSFLIDKIGKKLFPDQLTIIDKPHQKNKLGSRFYDGEGVATTERVIIENGVLKTYFIDTYNSLKLGIEPTIASSTGLCMQLGDKDHKELMSNIEKGIWVTGFNGGNTNPTTGDFSFGIEGFFIEKGQIVKPVSEMNITGNLLSLWANLAEIGNDPRKNVASQIPSLLFNDVSFSGL